MDNKLIIKIEDKQFELDLKNFADSIKQDLVETFGDKNLKTQELLMLYLQKIQKEALQNTQIQDIIAKITL
ncbi:hypothetical protein CQA57_06080 [Helicobacter anseris]|uniref:Uncharacterized protein n=1 Tax=Helicobacter anseris TaxID=375926 RepID=A0A3D8J6J3_9HELI|nr:hypothetical protein [Helicobacter anseris]RDU72815.1 hypothetical protein CQA57_06080 [Helicobacter anseris]